MSKKNMVEKKFENSIISILTKQNIINKKNLGGNLKVGNFTITQQNGWPDLMVFINGLTYFIEFKTDIGTLEESQKEFFPKILESGFEIFIARPKHYELYKEKNKRLNKQGKEVRGQFNIYDFVKYCELFSELNNQIIGERLWTRMK